MPSRSTRESVLSILRRRGPQTVAALSRELGITPAAVRQHLVHLEAEGWVQPAGLVRGMGRPGRTYALTPEGEGLFPQHYDLLALELLEAMYRLEGGEVLLQRVLGVRRQIWRERYSARLAQGSLEGRLAALVAILNERGSFPELLPLAEGGYLLTEHHCTLAQVAVRFPVLCDEEQQWLAESLGVAVERRRCRALGDEACAFAIAPRLESAAVQPHAAEGG